MYKKQWLKLLNMSDDIRAFHCRKRSAAEDKGLKVEWRGRSGRIGIGGFDHAAHFPRQGFGINRQGNGQRTPALRVVRFLRSRQSPSRLIEGRRWFPRLSSGSDHACNMRNADRRDGRPCAPSRHGMPDSTVPSWPSCTSSFATRPKRIPNKAASRRVCRLDGPRVCLERQRQSSPLRQFQSVVEVRLAKRSRRRDV